VTAAPALIALSGLAPFLVLAGWIAVASDGLADALTKALIGYGAVVHGFTGGVRWGAELARSPQTPHLGRLGAAGLQTVPAFGALVLVGLERPLWALGLLAIAGFLQLMWDLGGARLGLLPGWTACLRLSLTVGGLGCLGVGALAVLRVL
jgi:hypothetical protein